MHLISYQGMKLRSNYLPCHRAPNQKFFPGKKVGETTDSSLIHGRKKRYLKHIMPGEMMTNGQDVHGVPLHRPAVRRLDRKEAASRVEGRRRETFSGGQNLMPRIG